ncbi:hypothetical protein D3C72_580640 [compost metagenome]
MPFTPLDFFFVGMVSVCGAGTAGASTAFCAGGIVSVSLVELCSVSFRSFVSETTTGLCFLISIGGIVWFNVSLLFFAGW